MDLIIYKTTVNRYWLPPTNGARDVATQINSLELLSVPTTRDHIPQTSSIGIQE